MQQCCNATGIFLARRTCKDDGAQRCGGARSFFDGENGGSASGQIVGHAPAVDAPVVDRAGKGIALPTVIGLEFLAVRMCKDQQAAFARIAFIGADDSRSRARRLFGTGSKIPDRWNG